jgi:hypothetical protein
MLARLASEGWSTWCTRSGGTRGRGGHATPRPKGLFSAYRDPWCVEVLVDTGAEPRLWREGGRRVAAGARGIAVWAPSDRPDPKNSPGRKLEVENRAAGSPGRRRRPPLPTGTSLGRRLALVGVASRAAGVFRVVLRASGALAPSHRRRERLRGALRGQRWELEASG